MHVHIRFVGNNDANTDELEWKIVACLHKTVAWPEPNGERESGRQIHLWLRRFFCLFKYVNCFGQFVSVLILLFFLSNCVCWFCLLITWAWTVNWNVAVGFHSIVHTFTAPDVTIAAVAATNNNHSFLEHFRDFSHLSFVTKHVGLCLHCALNHHKYRKWLVDFCVHPITHTGMLLPVNCCNVHFIDNIACVWPSSEFVFFFFSLFCVSFFILFG